MNSAVIFLRLSYWTAAIADFIVAILVWMPERMGVEEIVYPMGLASVIAFSWGVMLVLADRAPLQRRWVLVPTILVVSLLTVVRILFTLDGSIEFSFVLLVFPIVLVILMVYSYFYAGKYAATI
jgi:hypothetical protein